MKMYRNNQEAGVTLVETLIAISIGTVIALVVMAVVVTGIRSIHRTTQYESLHANMAFTTEVFSRLMRHSIAFEVLDEQTLHITLPDEAVTLHRTDDGTFVIDDEPITTADVHLPSLSFTAFPRSVRLEAEIAIIGEPIEESFATTVATREAL